MLTCNVIYAFFFFFAFLLWENIPWLYFALPAELKYQRDLKLIWCNSSNTAKSPPAICGQIRPRGSVLITSLRMSQRLSISIWFDYSLHHSNPETTSGNWTSITNEKIELISTAVYFVSVYLLLQPCLTQRRRKSNFRSTLSSSSRRRRWNKVNILILIEFYQQMA